MSSKALDGKTVFQVLNRRNMLFFCDSSTLAYAGKNKSLKPVEKHRTKGPLRFFTSCLRDKIRKFRLGRRPPNVFPNELRDRRRSALILSRDLPR